MLTGGPGTGKSSVLEALSTLLDNDGIPHGAIESEQLGWGDEAAWLSDAVVHEQLAAICEMQRGHGRSLFLVAATTETEEDLRGLIAAIGADRSFVVCLAGSGRRRGGASAGARARAVGGARAAREAGGRVGAADRALRRGSRARYGRALG